jgi:hypothetical protein
MQRVISLPNGRPCGLGVYVRAWKTLKALPTDAPIRGFSEWSDTAGEIVRELLRGLQDRINRHDPSYGRGRKWDHNYQSALLRDSRAIAAYRIFRIVVSGSGLETPEGRRCAPDVHARFRAWRDDWRG